MNEISEKNPNEHCNVDFVFTLGSNNCFLYLWHHGSFKYHEFIFIFKMYIYRLLIPYAEEIIGDHKCGFRRNRSTTDHIFCIRQILEKKWEHSEAVHQLFIDFKKAYDSVRREAL